jgi:6,7-dimethyl-8-ribityllumazine synthase
MQSHSTNTYDSKDMQIAILVSSYHEEITNKLAQGAVSAFLDSGGEDDNYKIIEVAGAWELPVVAKKISTLGNFDAIVALGCIITGETTHDKVIANGIANGLMKVSLDWGHPVSMGVLTCQSIEQAKERAGGNCGNKGIEAMQAAIQTETSLREQHAK